MNGNSFVALYITAKDRKEAERIGGMLLKKRLAGCVNMWPCASRYWWKGKIEAGEEYIIVAKSKESIVERAIAEIKAMHSYEVPCINVLRIAKGNPHWLNWLEGELR